MSTKPNIRKPRARYHHGALKAAALTAGLQELDAQGHVGFSLERVAKRLGVSPAALYRHYTNRDELLQAVLWSGFERFAVTIDAAAVAAAARDDGTVLQSISAAYLRFAVENPGWFRAQFSRQGAAVSEAQAHAQPKYAGIMGADIARAFGATGGAAAARWRVALWGALHGAASMAVERTIPTLESDEERIAFAEAQTATILEGMRAVAALQSKATSGSVT